MSDYETRVGKVKKLEGDYEEILLRISKRKQIPEHYNKDDFNNIKSFVRCEFSEYVVTDDAVYEVIQDKNLEDYDIMEASKNDDGTIDYLLRYYNGGCSFSEAFEAAVKNIKD